MCSSCACLCNRPNLWLTGAVPRTLFTVYKKKPLPSDVLEIAISQLEHMQDSQIYNLAKYIIEHDNHLRQAEKLKDLDEEDFLMQKYNKKHIDFYKMQVKLNSIYKTTEKIIIEMANSKRLDMILNHENSISTKPSILIKINDESYQIPVRFYKFMEEAVVSYVEDYVKPALYFKAKLDIISYIKNFLQDGRAAGCKGQHLIVNTILNPYGEVNSEVRNDFNHCR